MESSLPANNLVALKFLTEFSDSQYELGERQPAGGNGQTASRVVSLTTSMR